MKKHRILVVDDEPVLCDLVEESLSKEKYIVEKAYDVQSAMEMLNEKPFDLVLTDWVMPGKSGMDLLNEIRLSYPQIGVIIVTAFGTISNAVQAMKKGASYFLPKPFSPEEVEIIVEKTLEELKTHKRLQDSELKFDTLFENAPDAIIIADVYGNLTSFNAAAEQISGYAREDVIQKEFKSLFTDEEQSKIGTLLTYIKEDGEVVRNFQSTITTAEDETIPVNLSFSPLKNSDNKIIGAIGIFQDLSGQKKLIDDLKKANKELKKLDKLKTDFISSVSHELRTPLSMIKGFASLVHKKSDLEYEKRDQFLQIVEDESERLTRLVEDLLDLSKIESEGKTRLTKEELDLSKTIKAVIKANQLKIQEKNIELINRVNDSSIWVYADKDSIKRVLTNLIDNAIKFNFENGKVIINYEEKDEVVTIKFEDTGMGIPSEDLDNIFKKFYRVERPGMEIRGTGLGLAIVKNLVELHNGSIAVKSDVGKGSEFSITLPKLYAEAESKHRDVEKLSRSSDMDKMLFLTIKMIAKATHAHIGYFMKLDAAANELFIETAYGLDESTMKNAKLNVGEGAAGWVAENRTSLLIEDIEKDPFFKNMMNSPYETKSVLNVPLEFNGKFLGILGVCNKENDEPFNQNDMKICEALAEKIAHILTITEKYDDMREICISTAKEIQQFIEKETSDNPFPEELLEEDLERLF